MSSLEIVNLAGVVTGRLGDAPRRVDALHVRDGRIASMERTGEADTIVDAAGAWAVPGLIDSHAHVVLGDWTPRQSALGWIESSMHGGVTMMMSASEVHLPGRPRDPAGVKALALTAQRARSTPSGLGA
ncbi:MAG: hypothetical protein U0807_19210 [Candidatus Binatia bacterium]